MQRKSHHTQLEILFNIQVTLMTDITESRKTNTFKNLTCLFWIQLPQALKFIKNERNLIQITFDSFFKLYV